MLEIFHDLASFLKKRVLWLFAFLLLELTSLIVCTISPPSVVFLGISSSVSEAGKFFWMPYGFLYPFGISAAGITMSSSFLVGIAALFCGLFGIGLILKKASGPFHVIPVAIVLVILEVLCSNFISRTNQLDGSVDYWPAVWLFIPVLIGLGFCAQKALISQNLFEKIDRNTIWEERDWTFADKLSTASVVTGAVKGYQAAVSELNTNSEPATANEPNLAENPPGIQPPEPLTQTQPAQTPPQVNPQPIQPVVQAPVQVPQPEAPGNPTTQPITKRTSRNPKYCPFCGNPAQMRPSNNRKYSSCCKLPVDNLPARGECKICGETLATAGSFCGACGKVCDVQDLSIDGRGAGI